MDVQTGAAEPHGLTSVFPVDASASPGVAPPTRIDGSDRVQGGVAGGWAADYEAQVQPDVAACSAAMSHGQDVRNAMLGHYEAHVQDDFPVPPVPDSAVPPSLSDLYVNPGMEPTQASSGMAGPWPAS